MTRQTDGYPVFFQWPKDELGNEWACGEINCPELPDEFEWRLALGHLLPSSVKNEPEAVAEYIKLLQDGTTAKKGLFLRKLNNRASKQQTGKDEK